MPKKKKASPSFVSRIDNELAVRQERKEQLDFLVPTYRQEQTERDRHDGNMSYIKPTIVSEMEAEGLDEFKAKRSFAALSYTIEDIKGAESAKLAAKVRRIIARHLGEEKAKNAVHADRKTVWKIDRDAVREAGDEAAEEVQRLLGSRVSLSVGPIPKRVKRRQPRKGR